MITKNGLLILIVVFCCYQISFAQRLDKGLQDLTNQISSSMFKNNKQKIAVIEFSDLDGKITQLGKYISEELITRLFLSKKFIVIERLLLNKVLEEHKLTQIGLLDEKNAKEIGKILGVDAICSGTITDLVTSIKINARLISTKTGSLFAVASTMIEKDEVVLGLINKKFDDVFLNKSYFFREDFSNYKNGEIPTDWIGTEHCMVKMKYNKNVLTTFEPGPVIIQIPGINFPKNFKLKWVIKDWSSGKSSRLHEPENLFINIGNLSSGAKRRYGNDIAFINNSTKKIKINKDVPIIFELDKSKDIFKLYIDGTEIIVTRFPNFRHKNSLTINLDNGKAPLGGRYQNKVDLILIEGIRK